MTFTVATESIETEIKLEFKEKVVAASTLEAKAHELLGHLGPGKLAAVVQLLEVMVHGEDEDRDTLSPAEARAIAEADEWLKHNEPIPHEQVLAEFGLTTADWEKLSLEP